MPEPAFLVEGQMEQRIIRKLCPNRPVRLIGCNGDDVSMAAVAKALNAQMRLLRAYSPIVILLDRERREKRCPELIQELSSCLDSYNHNGRYVIGIADRTIENWILSDRPNIVARDPRYKPLDADVEGEHGKSVIRRLLPTGLIYHETTVGVELFLRCRASQIFAVNKSFQLLIAHLNLECWWLKDIDPRFSPTSWSETEAQQN